MATATQNAHQQSANIPNGDPHNHSLPPPTQPQTATAKKGKAKKDTKLSAEENAKLVQARLSQLEQEKAGEKTQQVEIDREVKKATRDLNDLIQSVKDPIGRMELVLKKHEELLADMKKLERDYSKTKKRADQQQKDQDKAKSEHNKTATMKDKLEKLCRELTKENKKVKDENKRLEVSEKAAKETVNDRLDQMLYDAQELMNSKGSHHAENLHMELDELFKTRVKVLADQTELRELHFKSVLRHKDAEIAHLAAKHEVERRRADAEAARCRTLTNQVSTFSHTEAELRSQLNIYVEKFKQVEDTLNNSNELFLTFRKEMEEMSKKTKRLEKENLTLTRKHDQTNRNILEMAEERTRDKEEVERLKRQETRMRGIIRGMQEQGRGIPASSRQGQDGEGGIADDDGTESEYDEEYDEDEEYEEEEGDFEEGEEEAVAQELARQAAEARQQHQRQRQQHSQQKEKPVFGPVPPPDVKSGGNAAGKEASAGQQAQQLVNGLKH